MTDIPNSTAPFNTTTSFTVGDTLTLGETGFLLNTAGITLALEGASQSYSLTTAGTIWAVKPSNAAFFLSGVGSTSTITNTALGVIKGFFGFYINEQSATIINDGAIIGTNAINRDVSAGALVITNNGLIQSDVRLGFSSEAIAIGGTADFTLTNSGIVRSALGTAVIISYDGAGDTITNSGAIFGNWFLGGGVDSVTNTGNISGTVSLGGDGDTFDGSGSAFVQTVDGEAGNDTITGGSAGDNLSGGADADTLTGGGGTNTLTGGTGGDSYYVSSSTDIIVEAAGDTGANSDWVFASVSYALTAGAEIERLQTDNGFATTAINLTGNAMLAQEITGNDGNNILDGGGDDGFEDVLFGRAGNDTYVLGGQLIDTVSDSSGIDTITSTISRDLSAYAGIENLILLGTAAITGTGDAAANAITGNVAANVLDGGIEAVAQTDVLIGGLGDDTYVLGNQSDTVVEALGAAGGTADTITSTISRGLLGYSGIENLTLVGAAAINGSGNALANVLTGNAAANTLFGSTGTDTLDGGVDAVKDTLIGGTENDIYIIRSALDDIVEAAGGGTGDRVRAAVSFSLAVGDDIEFMETNNAVGGASINLTGNDLAQTITGNAGNNTIHGGGGADILSGGSGGVDHIFGDAGNDIIRANNASFGVYDGGADNDTMFSSVFLSTMTGGTGVDTINFSAYSGPQNLNMITGLTNFAGESYTNFENAIMTVGVDVVVGTAGTNVIDGRAGDDVLTGGKGRDIVYGGIGSDRFVFSAGDSGQTDGTKDIVADYTKGALNVGDKFDFSAALRVGGTNAAATALQASINAATGVATFAAGSGTTLADALADIATSFNVGGTIAGEFAFFKVNGAGPMHLLISDGVAGIGLGDTVIQISTLTSVASINLFAGDLTVLV